MTIETLLAIRERYHAEEPELTIADQLRNAWWGMVTVLDDLRSELNTELMTRAFDETTSYGQEEDGRHSTYLHALNELTRIHGEMLLARDNVIRARQSLIEWRKHDPTERLPF